MAGIARQSHMGKVPMAPSLSPAYFSPLSLAPFKCSDFPFSYVFPWIRICLVFRLSIGIPVFLPCRITQIAIPPHSGPNGFPLGLGLQKKSQNRTQGQHGLHAGVMGSLRFAIYSRSRGQGRKERKGHKNYGPNSCVTCGTCVTGSSYSTSTSRCPLLR